MTKMDKVALSDAADIIQRYVGFVTLLDLGKRESLKLMLVEMFGRGFTQGYTTAGDIALAGIVKAFKEHK